ncbi:DUF7002 family protein [Actinomycetospora aeridis]|uniref:Uncharacterized protein n=1 Tax=Actinomycetospora aeridis TaxID=3129231 RepID=A0ABU8N0H3_9PSEU
MIEDELIARHPRVFHMASAGAWPALRDHGLRTTRQIVDACAPGDDVRRRLLEARRTESTSLEHPTLGSVVIRDQMPLQERNLHLVDMTFREWLDVLNGRVFFWVDEDRLAGLLEARLYRGRAHDVITLDTAGLLAAHRDRVRLAGLNSGATLFPNAPPRGAHTFTTIEDHPWPARAIVELAVVDGVHDIDQHVLRVERRGPGDVRTVLLDREAG